ncbi:hypothetical protein N7530_002518 [Penicillium desertorum]|uniref:Uncharacterized protein n=1 Tax=Penicillium desertorum TaxID=1303715 RepID=A0A9W9X3N1_9EURO|nr:hypothetical protein N7530_002518 [Penicillium desertorum]
MDKPDAIEEAEWQSKLVSPYTRATKLTLRPGSNARHIDTILIYKPSHTSPPLQPQGQPTHAHPKRRRP